VPLLALAAERARDRRVQLVFGGSGRLVEVSVAPVAASGRPGGSSILQPQRLSSYRMVVTVRVGPRAMRADSVAVVAPTGFAARAALRAERATFASVPSGTLRVVVLAGDVPIMLTDWFTV
jgi:hypothetical protein